MTEIPKRIVTCELFASERPSSLGGFYRQLSFRWQGCDGILPPVLRPDDELQIRLVADPRGSGVERNRLLPLKPGSPDVELKILLIGDPGPLPVSPRDRTPAVGELELDGVWNPEEGSWDFPSCVVIDSERDPGFSFRMTVTTPEGVFTVDPEMYVGIGTGGG